jgi:hypothetical protein
MEAEPYVVSGGQRGIFLKIRLANRRGSGFILSVPPDALSAVDNNSRRLKVGKFATLTDREVYSPLDWSGRLESGQSITIAVTGPGEHLLIQADVTSPTLTSVVLRASGISSIENAQWLIPVLH